MMASARMYKRLLCIVPPYATDSPPLGVASLLGYLRAHGCGDFGFVDLRLWSTPRYAPTYSPFGVNGESYVIDVPDLPLVLDLLRMAGSGHKWPYGFPSFLRAYCSERAIDVDVLVRYLGALGRLLDEAAELLRGAEFVGFSVWTSNYLTTLMLAQRLKASPRPPFIVLGGPQVTESRLSAALALRAHLADVVVNGEGEQTLLDLVTRFDPVSRTVAGAIPGTTYCDSDRPGVIATVTREPSRLKDIVAPDFAGIPIAAYQVAHRGERVLPLQMSRGCTDKCSFCSEWGFWTRYRLRDVDASLDIVAQLAATWGVDRFRMMDSLLNGVPHRLAAFAQGLLDCGIAIRWSGFMRAQMDSGMAQLLAASGFDHAFVGVESLDDHTLTDMNKRREGADNLSALYNFLSAGISVRAGLIAGFPGDTPDRFRSTLDGLGRLRIQYGGRLSVSVEPFLLSPGQPMYQNLACYGLATDPWPEEMLALAPAYADLCDSAPRVVRGPGQDSSRVANLHLANQRYPGASAWTDHDTSPPIRSVSLFDDWQLTYLEVPDGFRDALILRGSELNALQVANVAGDIGGFERQLRRLRDVHLVGALNFMAMIDFGSSEIRLNPFTRLRATGTSVIAANFRSGTASLITYNLAAFLTDLGTRAWAWNAALSHLALAGSANGTTSDDLLARMIKSGLIDAGPDVLPALNVTENGKPAEASYAL